MAKGIKIMIIKQVDNKESNDKFIKAGLKAEKQMAHYLDRAFGKSQDIFVLNDIRLKNDTDTAQIDHLIIHTYGFIIVESKSVSTKVSVNKYGEWKRIFKNKETGMPSPVQQAKRQASFLEDFLQKKAINVFKDSIINKVVGKPKFSNYKFNILVAISDTGIIEREHIDLDEVVKADIITDKVLKIISDRRNDLLKSLINPFSTDIYTFQVETKNKIANLLLTLHNPVSKQINNATMVQEEPINYQKQIKIPAINRQILYECSKCKSKNLEVAYGRNYYFKCLDCANNVPIKHTCNTPNCKPKTRKNKLQFFKVCESCNIDELFWENKP